MSLGLFSQPASAGENYLNGSIVNLSSAADGLMIMLSNGVPTNCTGVAYNWMLIPEANKTMIAVALLVWQAQGTAMVYTNALSGGVCTINQFDPSTPIG